MPREKAYAVKGAGYEFCTENELSLQQMFPDYEMTIVGMARCSGSKEWSVTFETNEGDRHELFVPEDLISYFHPGSVHMVRGKIHFKRFTNLGELLEVAGERE